MMVCLTKFCLLMPLIELRQHFFTVGKQSRHECKTKKFMQKCLQSTRRESGVASVEFLLQTVKFPDFSLVTKESSKLNKSKTNQIILIIPRRNGGGGGGGQHNSTPAELKIYLCCPNSFRDIPHCVKR